MSLEGMREPLRGEFPCMRKLIWRSRAFNASQRAQDKASGETCRPEASAAFGNYDKEFDALILQVVSPQTETVVHDVDDHVALLYQPDDLEVVGLQVENFERRFLASHDTVRKGWTLSDACAELDDFSDMTLMVERMKPKVAREVVKAAEDRLGELGAELAAVFA